MNKKLLTLSLFFVFSLCIPSWSETKALLITINQKHLAFIQPEVREQLPTFLSRFDFSQFGELGGVLSTFTKTITNIQSTKGLSGEDIIRAWDDARADYVRERARHAYDEVIVVTGDTDDNEKMSTAFAQAQRYDAVDYFSLVHTDDQLIREEWGVATNKLRMVYSSACFGGHGGEHFIERYHAFASAGHNAKAIHPSASPVFSLSVLDAWIDGQNFVDTLKTAWRQGEALLSSQSGFLLARLMGGYEKASDAIAASTFEYAFEAQLDPFTFTINSFPKKLDDAPFTMVCGTF